VDPQHDTPEVLARYAKVWKAEEGRWWFLTGDKPYVYRLAEERFKVSATMNWREGTPQILHSEHFLVIDREGTLRGSFLGTDEKAMERLRKAVAALVPGKAGGWLAALPHANAGMNGTSALLLLLGFVFIRARRVGPHKACMLGALAVSAVFLVSYVVYHANVGATRFAGEGAVRILYFSVLISHSVLAVSVAPLAGFTVWRAFKGQFDRHRRIARWTLPIWFYVSVTGVLVYLMLYHWVPGPALPK
jgi:uncharacterized membrane protein YozB (DUF420 family)